MALHAEALQIASPTGFDGILKEDVRFATGRHMIVSETP